MKVFAIFANINRWLTSAFPLFSFGGLDSLDSLSWWIAKHFSFLNDGIGGLSKGGLIVGWEGG